MSNPKYLACDTETGGLDPRVNPLLTAYFLLLDEDFAKVDDLSLAIIPNGQYVVLTEEAMKVNGINIDEHRKTALLPIEAAKQLQEFLKKHKVGNSKLTALGQNFEFDRGFLFEQLVPQEAWNKYCIRGYLDTKRIMDFMVDIGMYPSDMTSLEKSVNYLEIEKLGHHDAKNDVIMTIEVYKKLRNMIKNATLNAGQIDQSLLESIE